MPRKRQVDLIVGSDLIHQRILKHGKPVSESNGDIAPNLAVGQFENAVGRQGGMAFGQRLKALLQISEGLVGKDAVDFPQRPLLDGQKLVGAWDGLSCDIVHECHEQI